MAKQKKQEEQLNAKAAEISKKSKQPIKEVKLPKISTKTSVPYQPSYKSLRTKAGS